MEAALAVYDVLVVAVLVMNLIMVIIGLKKVVVVVVVVVLKGIVDVVLATKNYKQHIMIDEL